MRLSTITEQTLIIVNVLQMLTWDTSLLLFCVISQMLSFCQFKDTLPISADFKAILTSPSVALKALAGQSGRPRHLKSSSPIFNCHWQLLSHLIKLTALAEGSAPAAK